MTTPTKSPLPQAPAEALPDNAHFVKDEISHQIDYGKLAPEELFDWA